MKYVSQSQLQIPVSREDILDHEDVIEAAIDTQEALFQRVRYQAGDCPLTQELWTIALVLRHAHERIAALREQGCFKPEKELPDAVPGALSRE